MNNESKSKFKDQLYDYYQNYIADMSPEEIDRVTANMQFLFSDLNDIIKLLDDDNCIIVDLSDQRELKLYYSADSRCYYLDFIDEADYYNNDYNRCYSKEQLKKSLFTDFILNSHLYKYQGYQELSDYLSDPT